MARAQQEQCTEQCAEDRLARWRKKWDAKATNFHLDEEHPVLTRHAPPLALGARVLLPLCGKSQDLAALADRGFDVVGVDGCAGALDAFAGEHGGNVEPGPNHLSVVRLPSTRTVGFRVGDFLGLAPGDLGGRFDGAFDRGGLVAVEPADRRAYAATLADLVRGWVLLVAVEHPPFDGGKLGPPFAVPEDAVHELFDGAFDVALLEREDRMDAEPAWRERGCDAFFETSYLLRRRQ